jgi:hypothetical protein
MSEMSGESSEGSEISYRACVSDDKSPRLQVWDHSFRGLRLALNLVTDPSRDAEGCILSPGVNKTSQ